MTKGVHQSKGSPTCSLDIEKNSMDVQFPQDYGNSKTFTYYITDQTIQQARDERKVDPIVEEVARQIARSWQSRKGSAGASFIAQYENAKGYLWRCLTEQQLGEFIKAQRGDKYQTSLLQFFDIKDITKRKADMQLIKDRLPKTLSEFLKGRNFWYNVYYQSAKVRQKNIAEWYKIYMR